MKTGVLLFNLGGPNKLKDVKPFLYNLFSDPDILIGIPSPFRQALAFTISRIKAKASIEMYKAIGGSSPQLFWTKKQADLLAKKIPDARIEVAMRAWNPTILKALLELQNWGATNLILLPLFPQFSTTTTGSCFLETYRLLKKLKWNPRTSEVRSWPEQPIFIKALRTKIDEMVSKIGKQVHILFSAHSLPLKIVQRKNDPYPSQVQQTITALTKNLEVSWSVSFQSRNGKLAWLQPYTDDEIRRLAKEGKKDLLVAPISFVSDHIETLYEIDILYAKLAKQVGIENFHRISSLNDDPLFIDALSQILKETR